MTEEERRWARRGGGGRSVLVTLLVVALAGVVAWLLSERNARQWCLVAEGGALVVKKGLMLPAGRQAFKTDDPALAQAYAPLSAPPGAKLDEERCFDDRAALDQGLYDVLARWARDDIAAGRPETLERALVWLGRADRLAGLSTVQREDLRTLRAESGFFEGKQLLERSADALRQARERLRLTAASASPHAREADGAVRRIDPLVDELYRALGDLASAAGVTKRGVAPAPAPAPGNAPGAAHGDAPAAEPTPAKPAASAPTGGAPAR